MGRNDQGGVAIARIERNVAIALILDDPRVLAGPTLLRSRDVGIDSGWLRGQPAGKADWSGAGCCPMDKPPTDQAMKIRNHIRKMIFLSIEATVII